MFNKRTLVIMLGLAVLAVLLVAAVGGARAQDITLTPEEQLGKSMYFDTKSLDQREPVLRRLPRARCGLDWTY